MYVFHRRSLEEFLQLRVAFGFVNEHFANAFAVFPERFKGQRLSTIFLRDPAVAGKGRTRLRVNVYGAGQRGYSLPMECVVGEDQFFVVRTNQLQTMPARCAADGRLALGRES